MGTIKAYYSHIKNIIGYCSLVLYSRRKGQENKATLFLAELIEDGHEKQFKLIVVFRLTKHCFFVFTLHFTVFM